MNPDKEPAPVVHVQAGYDADTGAFWFARAEPGAAVGDPRTHEGDVPAALWERYDALLTEIAAVEASLVEHLDLDEHGRRRRPCHEWTGAISTVPEHWRVGLAARRVDGVLTVRHWFGPTFDTRSQAAEFSAGLPDVVQIWRHTGVDLVDRDRLELVKLPARTWWAECSRCGHDRADHPGAPAEVAVGEAVVL